MKKTAQAPANIAFIKYWGKKDEKLRLPLNSSISMNLSSAFTATTVEFSPKYQKDQIYFDGKLMDAKEAKRVTSYLNTIRKLAHSSLFAKIYTQNNFPKSAGIASSASGFAALTLAGTAALGLNLPQRQLSVLARLGSGSACRSIPDGFTLWHKGKDSSSSYAYTLYKENYWNILDIIVIVSQESKKTKSTKGHEAAGSSIFFKTRLKHLPSRINALKKSLKDKNFDKFGRIVEQEAIELHAIMMTQTPPLFYWSKVTMDIIQSVRTWQEEGLPIFFTIDAGPNVHLICQSQNEQEVIEKLAKIDGVEKTIVNKPAKGARLINNHLF